MTKQELSAAFQMAKDGKGDTTTIDRFAGYGLPGFAPIYCSLAEVAGLISWECAYIGGGYDMAAFDELAKAGRQRFNVIG